MVVAVLIGDGGRVEKRMIELESDVTDREVEHVAHEINRTLAGLPLDQARQQLQKMSKKASPKDRALESAVYDAIGDMIDSERRIFVGGAANLAAAETLGSERETLRRVYEAMDSQSELLRLLEEAIRPVSVRIGSEVQVEDLSAISVVAAPYGGVGEGGGSLGVIGPIRMDYVRAMAIVAAVARTLEASLRELGR
jgi:heat-inducible transcriptional repressor